MSNLSQKDKHSPVIQTGTPTLDQTNPQKTSTGQPAQSSLKKEIESIEKEEHKKKTGTR
jgi:hypothetical protein